MRIMVVEDEAVSREGACMMLRSLCPDAEIVGADSGQQALTLFAASKPDLIFLDIRMPGMDGLTFLERIREQDRDVAVVMLTTYDQFSYAQRAIRLGAMDFIVKPYTSETLRAIIDRVQEQMESRFEEDAFFMPDISQYLMQPSTDKALIDDKLHLRPENTHSGRSYLLRVVSQRLDTQVGSQHKMMKWLFRQVKESVAPQTRVIMLDSEDLFFLLVLSEDDPQGLDEEKLLAWFFEMEAQFGGQVCCIAGQRSEDLLRDLHMAYNHCKVILEYSFYISVPCVLSEERLHIDSKRRLDPKQLAEIKESVLKGELQAVSTGLKSMAKLVQTPPFMPVHRLLYTIHTDFLMLLNEPSLCVSESERALLADRMSDISRTSLHVESFFSEYELLMQNLAERANAAMSAQRHAAVEACLQYLQLNYTNPELTEEKLARRFFFSAGYFGNLFKQVTGQSFVTYLNRLRIEESKRLLETTTLKVYEIAEQTGFSSVNYFIRVFKQHMHMSPNRYRVLHTIRSD